MCNYYLRILFILVFSAQGAVFNPAFAEALHLDFHANAKMMHRHHGPVDNAYGLINVVIDEQGQGRMDVMFYNGSHFDWVKFNAEVKFIDANGKVVGETHVYRWLESAGQEGADERKVSKALSIGQVETIEVDFYLTGLSEDGVDEIARIDSEQKYF